VCRAGAPRSFDARTHHCVGYRGQPAGRRVPGMARLPCGSGVAVEGAMIMAIRPILCSLRRHKTSAALLVIEIALTCFIGMNAAFMVSQLIGRTTTNSGVKQHQLVIIRAAKGLDAHVADSQI